ncbi:unnamed protein product, partial [Polarella glacialis]
MLRRYIENIARSFGIAASGSADQAIDAMSVQVRVSKSFGPKAVSALEKYVAAHAPAMTFAVCTLDRWLMTGPASVQPLASTPPVVPGSPAVQCRPVVATSDVRWTQVRCLLFVVSFLFAYLFVVSFLFAYRILDFGEGGGERAHVLAIATEYRQEAVILQRSAQLLGYSFHFCGMREKWIGWGTKLVQYRRALKRGLKRGDIAATDPVLLIDGWDCAIVGPALEFSQKMASSPFADLDVPWY